MLSIQENRISMYFKVQTFLTQQGTTLTTAIPALAQTTLEFKALLQVIGDTVGQALESNQGYTQQKRQYRDAMRNRMLEGAGALRSYALSNNDLVLARKANYNKSTLDNMRDTELLFMASRLYTLLVENQGELDNFGFTAPQVAVYNDNLATLTSFLQTPAEQRGNTKAANQQLVATLEQTDQLLEIIDGMMETQRFTMPQIYNQYRADRLIDDNASGQSEPIAEISLMPQETKVIYQVDYAANRKLKIQNNSDGLLSWGLSNSETQFTNNVYEVEAGASSVRQCGSMDTSGNFVLAKNNGTSDALVTLYEEDI
ncbi:MAG: hypothetical protein JNM95_14290 [Chitinophagaceae bacterium]|nr:hypothetical protein [Chitinophagaceae bacterium]